MFGLKNDLKLVNDFDMLGFYLVIIEAKHLTPGPSPGRRGVPSFATLCGGDTFRLAQLKILLNRYIHSLLLKDFKIMKPVFLNRESAKEGTPLLPMYRDWRGAGGEEQKTREIQLTDLQHHKFCYMGRTTLKYTVEIEALED